jgi:hypothetical protein
MAFVRMCKRSHILASSKVERLFPPYLLSPSTKQPKFAKLLQKFPRVIIFGENLMFLKVSPRTEEGYYQSGDRY